MRGSGLVLKATALVLKANVKAAS